MVNLTNLFAGVTDRAARQWLTECLTKLRPRYPRAVLPCIGDFTEARISLAAGYDPTKIETSDVSIYSTILGAVYSETPLANWPIELSPELQQEYDAIPDDLGRASLLLWAIKCAQIKPNSPYNLQFLNDLRARKADHLARLKARLAANQAKMRGIKYAASDLRDIVQTTADPQAVVIANPPLYKGGYEKMFDGNSVRLGITIAQIDWNKEYVKLYERSRQSPSIYLWACTGKLPDGLSGDVVFSRRSTARWEYWLTPRRDVLKELGIGPRVCYRSAPDPKGAGRVIPSDYAITPETKVGFASVDAKVALYYRDLFAHKMGSTRAEMYFLVLLDGYVFGVVGFMMGDVVRMREVDGKTETRVSETFGFNKNLDRHPGSNRLLMMAITCRDMGKILEQRFRRNRFWTLTGLKTTCLTKYRSLKLNRGLLRLATRERLPNGQYKITYETEFYDRSFSDCVRLFLDEQAARESKQTQFQGAEE